MECHGFRADPRMSYLLMYTPNYLLHSEASEAIWIKEGLTSLCLYLGNCCRLFQVLSVYSYVWTFFFRIVYEMDDKGKKVIVCDNGTGVSIHSSEN